MTAQPILAMSRDEANKSALYVSRHVSVEVCVAHAKLTDEQSTMGATAILDARVWVVGERELLVNAGCTVVRGYKGGLPVVWTPKTAPSHVKGCIFNIRVAYDIEVHAWLFAEGNVVKGFGGYSRAEAERAAKAWLDAELEAIRSATVGAGDEYSDLRNDPVAEANCGDKPS